MGAQVEATGMHRKCWVVVGVVVAAVSAFAVPVSAAPAGDPDPPIDWTVTLANQPARTQRVGQPFDVFFLPVASDNAVIARATATYVVPDAFRIMSASGATSAGGGSGPFCDVTGQTIECPILTASILYPRSIMVRLLPLVTGQDISSTISIEGEGSAEPNPDPGANEVSFLTDVTASLVDVSASIFSSPGGDVAVGEAITYFGAIQNFTTPVPLELSASLEVPPDFDITSADWIRNGRDQYVNPYTESGSCPVSGSEVTCDVSWLSPVASNDDFYGYAYGYSGQLSTDYIYIVVTGTHTQPGTNVASSFAVASTAPDQFEVNPDPHPNSASTTIDVTATDLASPVSGTVTDPTGAPLDGATVLAYAPTDGFTPSASTTTASDGTYTFSPVAPGTYALVYLPPSGSPLTAQWAGGSSTRSGATPLTVNGGGAAINDVDERFTAAASIAGTVRGPDGLPRSGVTVRAFGTGIRWVPAATTVSGSDGSYQFPALKAGSYDVVFSPMPSSNLQVQWYRNQPTRATADPLTVTPGADVTAVDADLVGGGAISGTATGPGSAPLAGTRVMAYAPGDVWLGSYETVTATDGSYSLPSMDAGPYRIRFVPPASSGLPARWFDDSPTSSTATVVQVTAGTTQADVDVSWESVGVSPS